MDKREEFRMDQVDARDWKLFGAVGVVGIRKWDRDQICGKLMPSTYRHSQRRQE